jgi:hypothetical protein
VGAAGLRRIHRRVNRNKKFSTEENTMKGFVIAEAGHIVNILPAVDLTGGKKSQAFSMKNYQHATIIISLGVSAAAITAFLLKAGSATAAIGADMAGAVAIPFKLYKQETAGANNDVLDAGTELDINGNTAPTANDNAFYVIELDAQELPDGKPYVQLVVTNGSNSAIASAVAILSGARFAGVKSDTVTV